MQKKQLSLVFVGIFFGILYYLFSYYLVSELRQNPPESSNNTSQKTHQASAIPLESLPILKKEVEKIYGIPKDSFHIEKGEIKRNQYLGQILHHHGVSYPAIDKLVKKAGDVFDVRKIKANDNYAILANKDSANTARYFIYETSPINFVVFDLKKPYRIYKDSHPVDTVRKSFAGVINSSLYNTLTSKGIPAELVLKLANLYAWEVDFFRIQAGDRLKVIYEELMVNGEMAGVGKIVACRFDQGQIPFFAFHYPQSGEMEYFDVEGRSLKKSFLKAPLKYTGIITSRFSYSRTHPVLGKTRPHYGTDYAAPTGTPVITVGTGTVIRIGYGRGGGNYVKIRHGDGYTTTYMHLSAFKDGIRKGMRVKQGDVIGYVGSTGLATGPHAHLKFSKNGRPLNPENMKVPSVGRVNEKNKVPFHAKKIELLKELHKLEFSESGKPVFARGN